MRSVQRPVYAALSRMLMHLSPDDLDDVAQDAFVRIIDRLDRYRDDGRARFTTWAVTVAMRVGLDARRKKVRHLQRVGASEALDTAVASGPGPEARARGQRLADRVNAAMAALTPEQRGVLILRGFHELTYDEIGAALDLTVPAVKSRLNRARTALRDAMEGTS